MMRLTSFLAFLTALSTPGSGDLFYSRQWGLHNPGTGSLEISKDYGHTETVRAREHADIGWEEAQAEVAQKARAPVIVAVIDSGLDLNHEDLAGRIADGGRTFLPWNPPAPDPLHPLTPEQIKALELEDEVGHGTHMAGIIAANAGNGKGIAGAAPPSVKVLPLKVYRGANTPRPLSSYVAEAIRYAITQKVSVINMSLSWSKAYDSSDTRAAAREALQKGIILIASAGNDRKKEPTYPCSYDGVICAGAVSIDGSISVYSDYGSHIDLLGPGDDVVSTYPTTRVSGALRFQKYETLSGTSQAAPHLAAIAATLRSIDPSMSAAEVKARLFASAHPLPREGSALYGLAHLARALQPVTAPVFYPHFKDLKPVILDESTLEVSGMFELENFGRNSTGSRIEVSVNGAPKRVHEIGTIGTSARMTIPWSYHLSSLDESADLTLDLTVADASGATKRFQTHVEVARSLERIASVGKIKMNPQAAGVDFRSVGYQVKRNAVVPALIPILDYGRAQTGGPLYFVPLDAESGRIAVIDASQPQGIRVVPVPFVYGVGQVLRLDANQDGTLDYVVLGFGTFPDGGTYLQFCFMDADFNPLWKSQSAWQIPVTSKGSILLHSYSTPGSWVKRGDRLLPAMIASGTLPEEDNYPLSLARFQSAKHLYVLEPDAAAKTENPQILPLKIRALDSYAFRRAQKQPLNLEAFAPMTDDELARGEIRAITSDGRDLNAKIRFLEVVEGSPRLSSVIPGWNPTSFGGKTLDVLPAHSTAYVHFLDADKGSVDWFERDRTWKDSSEFQYQALLDPISNAIGAFDFGTRGKVWFTDTRFGFVGFASGPRGRRQRTFELERDAFYDGIELNAMYSPVVVGSTASPQAGVFIDSTQIRGERVTIAVYDLERDTLTRPARYSFEVPAGCFALKPFVTSKNKSALTLLCQGGDQVEWRSVDLTSD